MSTVVIFSEMVFSSASRWRFVINRYNYIGGY